MPAHGVWQIKGVLWGGSSHDPIFGFGQGNGAAPVTFACMSALVVNAYKQIGNGANLTSSYTCRMFILAADMYVDDTDLLHLAPSQHYSDYELVEQVQEANTSWGLILCSSHRWSIQTGKCFSCIMCYKCLGGKVMLKKLKKLYKPTSSVVLNAQAGKSTPSHI